MRGEVNFARASSFVFAVRIDTRQATILARGGIAPLPSFFFSLFRFAAAFSSARDFVQRRRERRYNYLIRSTTTGQLLFDCRHTRRACREARKWKIARELRRAT